MKMDKPLLFITIAFFVFGLIMVLSASSMESYMRYGYSPYYYFIRQGAFLGIGSIFFLIIINLPSKVLKKLAPILMILIILLLGGLIVLGTINKGTRGWFSLGPINIQPSEFAKVIVIIFLAGYYDKNKEKLTSTWSLIKPLILCVVVVGLVIIQPDLGTALIIIILTALMFYAVPLKGNYRKYINRTLIVGILVLGIVFGITKGSFLKSYQLNRFNFKNPCDRYQEETGYQLCNSFIAFKNGGLLGKGIGESTQKYLYLPESYTDFIFPIIVEEWGVVVGLLILGIYTFMAVKILNIARRADNIGNSLLAYGVFIYFILHIIINLIGVMGLAPLTGVPLPFLSYGGSYCLSLFIAMGLVQ